MNRRRSRKLSTQMSELAFAAPQVVAHRMTRMALAGAHPSARDRREFALMSSEKRAAFNESWLAMGLQAWRAQQQMALACWQAAWMPWTGSRAPSAAQWQNAALGVLGQGLKPVHRRAVANAKRLGRTKLR
jgi:hypothetical protein